MNGLALCAGVGGLELGIRLATDDACRTVCFVEREAHAAAALVARMEDGTMAPAPVWDDLATFDGRRWRGVVDLVSAGYPCQPFSLAGDRRGHDDPRHLWPHVARIVSEIGPDLVFLENVTGHLSLGFAAVADDLERMGYRVACGVFSAGQAGSPQRRERLFVLAHRQGERCGEARGDHQPSEERPGVCLPGVSDPERQRLREQSGRGDGAYRAGPAEPRDTGLALADADAGRCGADQRHDHQPGRQLVADGRGEGVVHPGRSERRADASWVHGDQGTGGVGESGEPGVGDPDVARSQGRGEPERIGADQLPAWPPGPADDWSRIPRDLWPATEIEPGVRGMADGVAARVDRLRACGNGVVPLVAADALRVLARELVIDRLNLTGEGVIGKAGSGAGGVSRSTDPLPVTILTGEDP